ncbi:hypothetical protein tpqmel_0530 [Candidatus Gastranaerophilus sp. (ex Termes propinquus)]|nr:hypothetical protein tpqmel_0530 [Candidatus Gastranaerophilus sp. (ex Termes propinquus)]
MKKSINSNPFFEGAWCAVIEEALKENKIRGARSVVYITTFLNTRSFKHYFSIALLYNKLKEYDRAALNLRYALNLNPDFESADRMLSKLSGEQRL